MANTVSRCTRLASALPALCALFATALVGCAPGAGDAARSSRDVAPAGASSAATEALSADIPLTQVSDTLWLLAADPAHDAVRPTDTHDSLVARYGAENVKREDVEDEDGWMVPVTVLFPEDSLRRLEIFWRDTIERRTPQLVSVSGSAWHVPPGIRLGVTLGQLESMNEGPFELVWFRGHDGGTLTGWSGGKLDSFDQREGRGHWSLYLRLDPPEPYPPDVDFDAYGAEAVLSSAHPVMQHLRPRVVQMELVVP